MWIFLNIIFEFSLLLSSYTFLIIIKGKHNLPLHFTFLYQLVSLIDSLMSKSTILYDSGFIFKEDSAHECMKSMNLSLSHTLDVLWTMRKGRSIYLILLSWPSRRTAGGEWGSGRSGRTTGRTALSGMSGCCSFSVSLRGRKKKKQREREKDETHLIQEKHFQLCVCAGRHGICLSVCVE